jgi:capsid protein
VDPQKEFNAMLTAVRSGLMNRSGAISAFDYDAEEIDREIAVDNARVDELGLVFDSDPRHSAELLQQTSQGSKSKCTRHRLFRWCIRAGRTHPLGSP